MVKRFIPALLLLAAVPFLSAENNITIDMTLYNTVIKTREADFSNPLLPVAGDTYWAYGLAGNGALSFKSTGNSNVRADLALDFTYPDFSGVPVINLQKAYVKAKFPSLRLTVGKTRLGWGDGFVFNSGDVVFGSLTPDVNLVGSEVRTETAWLTSLNFPLGRFSFAELVVRAPDMIYSGTTPVGLGNILDLGFGGRVYSKVGGLKIEVGYYFDGKDYDNYDLKYTNDIESINVKAFQRPYISLQGNIGPDFYINSSAAIPAGAGESLGDIVLDTWSISLGLFQMIEVGFNNSLTLRFEALFQPYLNFGEDDGPAGTYATMYYPEIGFAIGQNVNLTLRSIFCPVDWSAMITGGVSWNVFEGFNLLAYSTFFVGDGDDTFSWKRDVWIPGVDTVEGVSIMAGVQYIY